MSRLPAGMACLLFLIAFGGDKAARAAGQEQQQASTSVKKAAVNPAGYVGQESCARCHEDVVKNFGTNLHSRLTLEHAGKGATCESCHGPGKAHVDSGGDVTKIVRFGPAGEKQSDENCLKCHGGRRANFRNAAHAEQGVGCTSCHGVHQGNSEAHLLKVSQPQLCYQCHSDVKPAFSQPFHHRVDEGLMNCSDCHDPHGSFGKNNLRATADQNAVCARCHRETAGPFAYEHPVVSVEGCVSCHSPHGSANAHLLNVSSVNALCQQCHAPTNAAASAQARSAMAANQTAQEAVCTSCHTQIHGSNTSNIFLR